MRKIVVLILSLLFQAGLVGAAVPHLQWPSVAEQLQRDHVRAGTELERLIRSNQDFAMLRPDEATDDRGIPPWLRVFWRKAHPELTYRADDPSGGYPLVLRDIYAWMVFHQDLVAGQLQEQAAPEKALTVGSNQRISGLQISPRSESDIRINFWNTNKVIAASNDIETSGIQAQFYSTDGGATWGQTSLPLMPGDIFQGDPAVDWTSDGTAWATSLGIVNTMSDIKVKAYRSIDGGATWTYDATVSGTQSTADKEMLWSDHSATSPFKDNLYVVWVYHGQTYLNRRTGPAGSWGTPITILVSTFSAYPGADVKTNAFGDVFVFWPGTDNGASATPNRIFGHKSTDAGQTFQAAITVGQTYGLNQYKIPAQAKRSVLISVSGGAYRTAFKNLVYASWNDLTGASGCTSNADAPGTNTASSCKSRIWFARSTDGGATWSTPVMINNQASLNDQFFPHLAVDETNGVVSIVYYDTIGDPGRLKTDFWYQSSYDGGVTWSTPTRVTTAQTNETVAGADLFNQYGDYTGMSAYAGLFLPSWTDRRNNAREEIWTAKVLDVPPPPASPSVWVSVNGNDANDCTRATPCRTFSGTLAKISPGGELDILDSGDFGPVTINKSVSLVSSGPLGGIQIGTGTAITINAGANDKVVLRGLTIDGLGTGLNGISFVSGGSLYIEDCTINNFSQYGLDFAPTNGTGKLFITTSLVRNTGVGTTGGAVHLIAATGQGFVAAVDGLRSENSVFGLKAETLGVITVRNSLATNNGYSGFSAVTPSGSSSGALRMLIENSVTTHNGTNGVVASGPGSIVTISNIVVTNNQTGLNAASGGSIISFGNNKVQGNTTDGTPSQTIPNQ